MRRRTLWSLEQMLGLTGALQALHQDNCRHGDVKPGNILHFLKEGDEQGILKMSDFGISKVHHVATFGRLGQNTKTGESTPSYEPPEGRSLSTRSPALAGTCELRGPCVMNCGIGPSRIACLPVPSLNATSG